eukprot:SAG31_NODE_3395_length_4320_cov_14.336413_2_plen_178_part_00
MRPVGKARYMYSHIDASQVKVAIRNVLEDPDGQVQKEITAEVGTITIDPTVKKRVLREESLSMMQVVKSTSNYNALIESSAELMYANKRTDAPVMIAVDKTCFASLFKYLALRHGSNATIVGKQLKILLQNLSGLLANKRSVSSLRAFMKDIILRNWTDLWNIVSSGSGRLVDLANS